MLRIGKFSDEKLSIIFARGDQFKLYLNFKYLSVSERKFLEKYRLS